MHKSSYLHGLVKKGIVKEWLSYLVATPLYKHYDIKISQDFLGELTDESEKPMARSTDDERQAYEEYNKRYNTIDNTYDDIDDFYNKNIITSDEDYYRILSAGITTTIEMSSQEAAWFLLREPTLNQRLRLSLYLRCGLRNVIVFEKQRKN